MIRNTVIAFFVMLFIFLGAGIHKVFAVVDCLTINTASSQADKDYCKKVLAQYEAELADLEAKVKQQNKQSGNYASEVKKLTTQIDALKTKVKARALAIAQLKVSIKEKVSKIENLSDKIDREYESIAQLLRNTNEFDNENLIHLVLSDESLSAFYSDLESYASIKQAVKESVDQIKGIKTETEIQKRDLEVKQDAETDAKYEYESAQKKTTQLEAEQKKLLANSKNAAAAYKTLAADKKAKADKIRSALFSLAGTSQKIEFGTALQYANEAKSKLGIDPAFLLAILTQESNLGANVGLCYLTNPDTGAGVGKNTGTPFAKVMSPTRDVPPFLEITSRLNLNPYKTQVSCPITGVVGWGGAMGPAQFIPSTWKIFEGRLKSTLGYEANPWAPRDAFIASSMYLTDLGAYGNSASSQSKAACKYYGSGGATCSYSKSVMALKMKIQSDIDLLSD